MRALLIIAALGAQAGWSVIWALGQESSETSPAGWTRSESRAPWMSPSTLGPLSPRPDRWSLGRYAALEASDPLESFLVDVDIPADGELVVQLASEPDGRGPGLQLSAEGAEGVMWYPDAPSQPLDCQGEASGTLLERTAEGFRFGGMNCQGQLASGPAVVRSGLQRVRLGLPKPPQPLSSRVLGALVGALAAAAVGFGQTRFNSARAVALATLPALICALVLCWDAASLVETLRIVDLPARRLPLILGLVPTLLAHAWLLTRGFRGRLELPATVAVLAGAGLLVGFLFDANWARVYLAGAGAALGGLAWLQRHRVRFYNLLSLALVLSASSAVEYALRWSSASQAWSVRNAQGAVSLAQAFAALEEGEHTRYPSLGFPTAFGPKQGPRVACLGGSSTGGAYQNDRIEDFYPAMMRPGAEVLNQGVGGWNSFHILLYLQGRFEELDPDVITLYLGVNEALETPADMRTLYSSYQQGGLGGPAVDLRLFQGFRLVVLGLREKTAAVPPDHFRDNLEAIVELVGEQGAKVLLLNEGVQPRPDAFMPYKAAMQAVAESHEQASFADSAVALQRLGPVGFLDQNHLSETGHRALAGFIDEALDELGWIEGSD